MTGYGTSAASGPASTCSSSAGVDHVIDYQKADFAADGRRFDLIPDIGGDSSLSRFRKALSPRGTLAGSSKER